MGREKRVLFIGFMLGIYLFCELFVSLWLQARIFAD